MANGAGNTEAHRKSQPSSQKKCVSADPSNESSFRDAKRRRKTPAPSVDRLPPHDLEAEAAALACVLTMGTVPADVLDTLNEKFRGAKEVFYDLRHQVLFETLMAMHTGGQAIDLITLQSELRNRHQLEQVGGLEYLAPLPDKVPSAANAAYYRDIVWDKFRCRQAIQVCVELVGQIYEHEDQVDANLARAEAAILEVNNDDPARVITPMPVHTQAAIKRIETAFNHRNQGLLGGVATGFSYWDKKTGGLHKGELTLIGGRPSTGKTSWLISLLLNVAVKHKLPVAFLSLESSAEEIVLRMMCSLAKANLFKVHSGMPSELDVNRLIEAAAVLAAAPIYIDDTPALTPNEFKSHAARLIRQYQPVLVGLDHLHEMTNPDNRGDENKDAKEAVTAAKWVARFHKIPVVALAQLNREFEKEGKGFGKSAKSGRKPRMSDLRGHGANEQKADTIAILYKDFNQPDAPELGEDDDPDELNVWPITLEVCKQRNGPTGPVFFTFLRESVTFADATGGTGSYDKKPAPAPAAPPERDL